ncbi:golgin candidate 2-like isoform X2 [Tripterygium wilfordii]|uniref:golgin candidate 2-like isoform X2 n=1 Tax=Tripterygium wilfordii TaxID=458696 RepID=UPI0018F84A13|nr:golgin candidate 2-like isoform X2 [Tripterygium wilfordii]
MANWISNKLKVAETFLQQIDQQAAESLKKGESPPRSDDQTLNVAAKAGGSVPLKDQLKKKTQERNEGDYQGKFRSDLNVNPLNNSDESSYIREPNTYRDINKDKESLSTPKLAPKPPKPTLTDSDWTELLGTSNQPTTSVNRSNGVSGIRGLRRDGRRQGSPGSVLEGKRNQRTGNGVTNSASNVDKLLGNRFSGKPSDGEESSSSSGRPSSVEMQNDGKNSEGQGLDRKDTGGNLVVKQIDEGKEGIGRLFDSREIPIEDALQSGNKNKPLETMSKLGEVDGVFEVKKEVDGVYDELRNVKGLKAKYGSRSSISDNQKRGSSVSDEGSDYDTESGSGSTSDSESEREREQRRRRRRKILTEKAAAKAVQAIKERENMVARLEGEKQSLVKILEERAKQQAQEASELQTSMMESMEAFEREKQKHNNTRMEAFVLLATLETANAELARSLASAQKNLEVEINQVAEIRQQLELKEVAREDLRRRIFKSHESGTNLNQLVALKGVQFEQKILEAEYSVIVDKIRQLQDKAKKLESDYEMTRKEIEEPTEVELELKRRLGQLTDHLIQKQAQVESLSSDKATLLFRIEAVSRMLDENKSMITSSSSGYLESGNWESSESKLRPLFEDKIRSGRKHLGSLLQQLDAIFLSGSALLRRNPTAKLWAMIYLVCLHLWVIYILMSPSQATYEGKSGAVISLQNINNTAGFQ